MKLSLEKNDIEMYSTHNERKSDVAEKFIRTLKNIICKYMTSVSKNVYTDKLDDEVNNYTYRSTIKTKPVDVKPSTYIESSKEINYQDPKFKIGDIVRTSKYKNIFAKGSLFIFFILKVGKIKKQYKSVYIFQNLNHQEEE